MRGCLIVAVLGAVAGTAACGSAAHPRTVASAPSKRANAPSQAPARAPASGGRAGAVLAAGGPVPRTFAGASLSFISSREGWVLGTAPCARPPCTSLVRTLDGGVSWRGVPAPRAPLSIAPSGAGVTEIRFVNAREGFAFAPGLWITADGARTWRRITSVNGIRPLLVISLVPAADGSVYALVGRGSPQSGAEGSLSLVRAGPGSTTFRVLRRFTPAGFTVSSLVSAGPDAYVADAGRLVRAAGAHVTSDRLPGQDCQLASSSRDSVLAICGYAAGAGSFGNRAAFGSVDGGRHWVRLRNPGRGDGFDISGVAETAAEHAVIATVSAARSGLLATFDGGRTWRLVLSYRSEGQLFVDLGFENDEDGSVIYAPARTGLQGRPAGILLRTADGGRTWHRIRF